MVSLAFPMSLWVITCHLPRNACRIMSLASVFTNTELVNPFSAVVGSVRKLQAVEERNHHRPTTVGFSGYVLGCDSCFVLTR